MDGDVIHVVAAGVRRSFAVGGGVEGEHAGGVDTEQGLVGTTDDAVDWRAAVYVGAGDCRYSRLIFCCIDSGRDATAVAGDHRGFVDVSDGYRDGLSVNAAVAVSHLYDDVVDVVAAGVRWGFAVGGGVEGEYTGGVDAEQGCVGATDAVGRCAAVDVAAGHCCYGGLVLGNTDCCCGTAAVAGDHRGFVDVGDGYRDGLSVEAAVAVGHLDGDVIHVIAAGIRRGFAVRGGVEGEHTCRVDAKECCIGAADDAVDRRTAVDVGAGDRRYNGLVLGYR